jgi:3-oxoacyl-[acyl-carrier-protein] synthase-3
MKAIRSVVAGCGAYLPQRVVTNEELSRRIDTSDKWIVERTGIRQRHLAADGELTSDLALPAAREALVNAGMEANDVDLVVLATATADETFPSTATRVQDGLGMGRGAAFDVNAACTGFVYALAVADNFLKAGQAETALVIGAETFSRILDWDDRNTCVLFGDGAGALVLRAQNQAAATIPARGVLSTHLHSDGSLHDLLYVDGGPSSTQTSGYVRMTGREVFRHAIEKFAEVMNEALEHNGLSIEDIDWLVPHQANQRIIDGIGRRIGLPLERIISTVERHANTSAASVPLALAEAVADGRIRKGDLVVLEAMGGGFTWGAGVVRW